MNQTDDQWESMLHVGKIIMCHTHSHCTGKAKYSEREKHEIDSTRINGLIIPGVVVFLHTKNIVFFVVVVFFKNTIIIVFFIMCHPSVF